MRAKSSIYLALVSSLLLGVSWLHSCEKKIYMMYDGKGGYTSFKAVEDKKVYTQVEEVKVGEGFSSEGEDIKKSKQTIICPAIDMPKELEDDFEVYVQTRDGLEQLKVVKKNIYPNRPCVCHSCHRGFFYGEQCYGEHKFSAKNNICFNCVVHLASTQFNLCLEPNKNAIVNILKDKRQVPDDLAKLIYDFANFLSPLPKSPKHPKCQFVIKSTRQASLNQRTSLFNWPIFAGITLLALGGIGSMKHHAKSSRKKARSKRTKVRKVTKKPSNNKTKQAVKKKSKLRAKKRNKSK